jgi:hypothetical protein
MMFAIHPGGAAARGHRLVLHHHHDALLLDEARGELRHRPGVLSEAHFEQLRARFAPVLNRYQLALSEPS